MEYMPLAMIPEADIRATRILVAGCSLRGDGYPNAWNTLHLLRTRLRVDVIELGFWLPADFHLWKLAKGPRHKAVLQLIRLLCLNAGSTFSLLWRSRRGDTAYVPYPSLFVLWLLSWIPRRWRPRCICDAYVTIWDTLYHDRALGNADGPMARLLRAAESRALRCADRILTDTTANADHVAQLFGVRRERIHAIPLAIDPEPWTKPPAIRPAKSSGKIRVLFIGTFVPLQGTHVIAQAIDNLRDREDLEFVLVGDGQQANVIAALLQDNPAVTWFREWQPISMLATHLAAADICLGVFGGDGKASRVLPFKLYMALAAGKPIITQSYYSTPDHAPPIPAITVAATTEALQAAIVSLASNPARRSTLQAQAAAYYRRYLDSDSLARHWRALLD